MIIPHIDLSVTLKCSLKCKNCTQWNPYIKNPKSFSSQSIIKTLEKLFSNVAYVVRIAIIGGEALLNQDLDEVIDFLAGHKKVGGVILITNGTIIPNEKVIDSLRRSNIQVWLDKYGSLSTKADELYRILTDNNIDVWFDPIHSWWDFGLMTRKYTDKRDIEENFDSCYLKDCCGLKDGKMYRCGRTYVLANNGIEQPGENEFVDVNAINSKKEMSRALRKFYSLDYIKACGWCNKKEDRKAIPTGEQL